MEPTTGIEPVNLFLTKEALYLLSYVGAETLTLSDDVEKQRPETTWQDFTAGGMNVERETRLELATSSLEG